MTVTHTLISFHNRVIELRYKLSSSRLAWQQTEKEYYEKFYKNRYKNYESFKVSHCQLKKIRPLNKENHNDLD